MMDVHEVRHPTLELDWLPLSLRKGLDRVRIAITGATDVGGRYWCRMYAAEPVLTDFGFDRREAAVIEVGARAQPGTLAHEFRHHWQMSNGLFQPFSSVWKPRDGTDESYWNEIKRFFSTYPEERDALLFEVRHAPDAVTEEWMDAMLRGPQ